MAPLRADVVSGAAALARTAAQVTRRAARGIEADEPEDLREAMAGLAVKILDAQPSMAPLVTLTSRTLTALEGTEDVEAGREAAIRAARAFSDEAESGSEKAAAAMEGILEGAGSVLTLSASSTVRRALEFRAGRGGLRVVCLESRPANEGRRIARALAEAGAAVTLAVDAAMGSLVPECDLVLLGADSVGDRGVVNKIGSRGVVALAREWEVPVYVLTDGTKLLPPGFPQPTDDDRPAEEVWKPPRGVRIWNRYFETFPVGWTTGVVTESGALSPDQVDRTRSALPVPEPLRRWAREHDTRPTT